MERRSKRSKRAGPRRRGRGGRRNFGLKSEEFGQYSVRVWQTIAPTYKHSKVAQPYPSGSMLTTRQLVGAFAGGTSLGTANGFGLIDAAVAATVNFTIAFQLADLPQVASFTALFDQYRIDEVELIIMPNSNNVAFQNVAAPNNESVDMILVADYDDNTALASWGAAAEYDNAITLSCYQGAHIVLRPTIAKAVWQGGAFSGYAIERAGVWLDCANTAIDHYGIKGIVSALQVAATEKIGWHFMAKYTMSFRDVR